MKQREHRRHSGVQALEELSGYQVRKLTEYQFRVNEVLDLYPTNFKYHNIRTQERGFYDHTRLKKFVEKQLAKVAEIETPAKSTPMGQGICADCGGETGSPGSRLCSKCAGQPFFRKKASN